MTVLTRSWLGTYVSPEHTAARLRELEAYLEVFGFESDDGVWLPPGQYRLLVGAADDAHIEIRPFYPNKSPDTGPHALFEKVVVHLFECGPEVPELGAEMERAGINSGVRVANKRMEVSAYEHRAVGPGNGANM